jgi:hypothetical protein
MMRMSSSRIRRLALCAPLLCCAGAAPCGASDPLAGLLACRDIPQAAARLECFDHAAAVLAAAPPVPPTPAASAAAPMASPPAAPPLDAKQQFGLPPSAVAAKEVAAGTRAAEASKIEAHIVGLSQGATGITVFNLDNGQVWRQLLADGDVLARLGDVAVISRGVFNSYWLQLKSGRGCKVTRIR